MAEMVVGAHRDGPARAAQRWALSRAARTGDTVVLVHAWSAALSVDLYLDPETVAAMVVDADLPRLLTLPTVRVVGHPGAPASVLLERSLDAGLLVLGSGLHRAGDRRASLAAQARTVGAVPVVVVPETSAVAVPSRVIVGVDLSAGAAAALRWAATEALACSAQLLVTLAWQHDADRARLDSWVEEVLGDCVRPRIRISTLHGGPLDALRSGAASADLVVLGSHGHRRAPRWLTGSTSGQLTQLCDCPIVVVPPPVLRLGHDG